MFLVESPIVLSGSFDERFLELPPRVVETAMQSHQRYFPLEGARFAFVANGGDPEVVTAGNERVLEGRLEDAHFTFERDVAKGIEALAAELGAITFVAGAGSFADKAARLQELVGEFGGGEASREAARLAKADQAAELVREFPDLEGHIGAEYARLAGFPGGCVRRDRGALPAGLRRRCAAAHGARARAGRRREDRQPHRVLRARPAADGLARPARPAPRGHRALPARGRRRARDRRRPARQPRPESPRPAGRERHGRSRPTSRTSSSSGWRASSTSPSSSSAPPARALSRSWGRSPSSPGHWPRRLPRRTSSARTSPTTARTGSPDGRKGRPRRSTPDWPPTRRKRR